MIFYETGIFTARIVELLSDESYRQLQNFLAGDPEGGDLIPGTHGLRKIRRAAGSGAAFGSSTISSRAARSS